MMHATSRRTYEAKLLEEFIDGYIDYLPNIFKKELDEIAGEIEIERDDSLIKVESLEYRIEELKSRIEELEEEISKLGDK